MITERLPGVINVDNVLVKQTLTGDYSIQNPWRDIPVSFLFRIFEVQTDDLISMWSEK